MHVDSYYTLQSNSAVYMLHDLLCMSKLLTYHSKVINEPIANYRHKAL